MKEFEREMGTNWSEHVDELFGNLSAAEAMDKLKLLTDMGGEEAVNKDPKSLQLIRAIANSSDEDITTWVNRWVPNRHPHKFLFFDGQMKYYRNLCRKALDLKPYEPKVN